MGSEQGMALSNPTQTVFPYIQKGGARIGLSFLLSLNYSTPFAQLVVGTDHIEITVMGAKKYSFSLQNVNEITTFKGVVSTGIKINHSEPGNPQFIVFWVISVSNLDALKRAFDAAEYKTAWT